MKTVMLIVLSALCIVAAGCGKIYGPVKETKAYLDDRDDILLQMSKKLEASPNPAGVDEARKVLESRKDGVKAKYKAINDAPQGFNSDWRSTLNAGETSEGKMLEAIYLKLSSDCKADCVEAGEKMRALMKDFDNINKS